MPAKRWIWLLCSVFLLSIVLIGRLHWSVLWAVCMLVGLSVYVPRYLASRLSFRREVSAERLFVGEAAALVVTLGNSAPVPVTWLSVRQNLPFALGDSSATFSASLAARDRVQVDVPLLATQRGFFPLGRVFWTMGDPLGFGEVSGYLDLADYVLVYPRLYALDGWPLRSRVYLGSNRAPEVWYEDPSRLQNLRDYTSGDGLKRIHWRASAKAGRLIVKEFEPTVTATFHIMVNLYEPDYRHDTTSFSDPELAIEFAASAAARLSAQGARIGLTANGVLQEGLPETVPASARNSILSLLEVLARATVGSACRPFADAAADALAGIPRGAVVLLVTPRPCAELFALARSTSQAGHRPAVFFVGRPKPEHVDQAAACAGVAFYWVGKRSNDEPIFIRPVSGAPGTRTGEGGVPA